MISADIPASLNEMIRNAVTDVLTESLSAIKDDIKSMKDDIKTIKNDIRAMKGDIKGIKDNVCLIARSATVVSFHILIILDNSTYLVLT